MVYARADGIKAGLEKYKAALLVVMGALSDGRQEVLALHASHCESTTSWLQVLRGPHEPGLSAARLVMSDGAVPIRSTVEQAAFRAQANDAVANRLHDLLHVLVGQRRIRNENGASSQST